MELEKTNERLRAKVEALMAQLQKYEAAAGTGVAPGAEATTAAPAARPAIRSTGRDN